MVHYFGVEFMCFWAKSPILCIFGKITLAINENIHIYIYNLGGFFIIKYLDLLINKLPNSTSGSNKVATNIQGCLNVFYFPFFSIAKFG